MLLQARGLLPGAFPVPTTTTVGGVQTIEVSKRTFFDYVCKGSKSLHYYLYAGSSTKTIGWICYWA